ncbi:uncharacterized protein BO72DRAFT_181957 [Aspergillus fijiensis CBS 313.89]|uniref:Uncharacterized protein n=1 Tax=Aspergillus fijiensis CBS 313.89 TaxID=1448319 RepID=A0A8G1RL36_9EURO|nr:uncharacterized protein BO72DRAFT_181957 [Aspergillus fijiensis CBS 313.89]RAK75249.1 hypothetical protein BO72DRAFT_181957 [Aspergillus fijiensis CBS 313.89]
MLYPLQCNCRCRQHSLPFPVPSFYGRIDYSLSISLIYFYTHQLYAAEFEIVPYPTCFFPHILRENSHCLPSSIVDQSDASNNATQCKLQSTVNQNHIPDPHILNCIHIRTVHTAMLRSEIPLPPAEDFRPLALPQE